MKSRLLQLCRTGFVLMTCLALVTPAWAGSRSSTVRETFSAYLQGVDECGCLTDCGGTCADFCAVVNCRTGKFVGKASGCVENHSCRNQCYRCVDLIDNCEVIVKTSVYKVTKRGAACYTACGCIEENGDSGMGPV